MILILKTSAAVGAIRPPVIQVTSSAAKLVGSARATAGNPASFASAAEIWASSASRCFAVASAERSASRPEHRARASAVSHGRAQSGTRTLDSAASISPVLRASAMVARSPCSRSSSARELIAAAASRSRPAVSAQLRAPLFPNGGIQLTPIRRPDRRRQVPGDLHGLLPR
jgi:hypothetical protein